MKHNPEAAAAITRWDIAARWLASPLTLAMYGLVRLFVALDRKHPLRPEAQASVAAAAERFGRAAPDAVVLNFAMPTFGIAALGTNGVVVFGSNELHRRTTNELAWVSGVQVSRIAHNDIAKMSIAFALTLLAYGDTLSFPALHRLERPLAHAISAQPNAWVRFLAEQIVWLTVIGLCTGVVIALGRRQQIRSDRESALAQGTAESMVRVLQNAHAIRVSLCEPLGRAGGLFGLKDVARKRLKAAGSTRELLTGGSGQHDVAVPTDWDAVAPDIRGADAEQTNTIVRAALGPAEADDERRWRLRRGILTSLWTSDGVDVVMTRTLAVERARRDLDAPDAPDDASENEQLARDLETLRTFSALSNKLVKTFKKQYTSALESLTAIS